eukprot:2160414-Karenia_brevis.AAC.1
METCLFRFALQQMPDNKYLQEELQMLPSLDREMTISRGRHKLAHQDQGRIGLERKRSAQMIWAKKAGRTNST